MSKKFNVSMDNELFVKFDDFCKRYHISRSACIAIAIQNYMSKIEYSDYILTEIESIRDIINKSAVTSDGGGVEST